MFQQLAASTMLLTLSPANRRKLRTPTKAHPQTIFRRMYEVHHAGDIQRREQLALQLHGADSTMTGLALNLQDYGQWFLDLQEDHLQVGAEQPQELFISIGVCRRNTVTYDFN